MQHRLYQLWTQLWQHSNLKWRRIITDEGWWLLKGREKCPLTGCVLRNRLIRVDLRFAAASNLDHCECWLTTDCWSLHYYHCWPDQSLCDLQCNCDGGSAVHSFILTLWPGRGGQCGDTWWGDTTVEQQASTAQVADTGAAAPPLPGHITQQHTWDMTHPRISSTSCSDPAIGSHPLHGNQEQLK